MIKLYNSFICCIDNEQDLVSVANRGATQWVKISVVHANVKNYECTI